MLVPGGQASLSSLLLEGHGVVALASLMFPPGGVDGVVAPGSGPPAHSLDHQLLRMALGPYPKLRSALFPPGGPRAGLGPPDVSIYQLLQVQTMYTLILLYRQYYYDIQYTLIPLYYQ